MRFSNQIINSNQYQLFIEYLWSKIFIYIFDPVKSR